MPAISGEVDVPRRKPLSDHTNRFEQKTATLKNKLQSVAGSIESEHADSISTEVSNNVCQAAQAKVDSEGFVIWEDETSVTLQVEDIEDDWEAECKKLRIALAEALEENRMVWLSNFPLLSNVDFSSMLELLWLTVIKRNWRVPARNLRCCMNCMPRPSKKLMNSEEAFKFNC